MNLFVLAMPLLLQGFLGFQDGESGELRFYRVHLRNGNVIDGDLVKDSPNEVLLRLKVGEMTIRRDQIEKVEFVKMKSSNAGAVYRPDPRKKAEPAPGDAPRPEQKVLADTTPEQIKKKVDLLLFKFKSAPGGDDKQIPYQEIGALGEEAVVYLAKRVPAFDLKTQDAMGVALIQLKPTARVVEVLENHLASENAILRAFAMNVLCVTGGDEAKMRYLKPMLRDDDPRVRTVALSMLGTATDRDWVEPLLVVTTDKDRDIRSRAIRIAQNLAEKHGLLDRLAEVMVANIAHSETGVRIDAINVLGLLARKESWQHMIRPLSDPEAVVRAAAAQAIVSIGAPEAGDEILAVLGREQDRGTRIVLAGAVQKFRLLKAIEPLIRWLGDSDEDIKKVAEATLQLLSGESFGRDPEKWSLWWEKSKSK
jgi:HEAT repeat protein